jgi:DNA uptake protein ComE-like DNA-binding protein
MRVISAFVLLTLLTLTGCTSQKQSPEELREHTAQATSELKENAKAVAEGVRDGLKGKDSEGKIDLNSASKVTLTTLPGVNPAEADVIIANRPYDNPHDLVTRKLMPQKEYDRIADKVTADK